mmetsp:Transcript_50360/g.60712  ORF Transcript_50360/g.60712 Transcript_50360/m.60712 type:complete len:115 (+) Transcript_50360:732-1076(+)
MMIRIMTPGMQVLFAPSHMSLEAKLIKTHHQPIPWALPRDNIEFNIKIVPVKELHRGVVACDANNCPASNITDFKAHVPQDFNGISIFGTFLVLDMKHTFEVVVVKHIILEDVV